MPDLIRSKMQSYNLRMFTKRFSALLLFFCAFRYEVNGCVDVQSWCKGNQNFCDNDIMKLNCPLTCGTCLPAECQQRCTQNCTVHSANSIECTCFEGYRLTSDGKTCEDIDECAENIVTCNEDEACQNVNGRAYCASTICTPFQPQHFVLSTSYEDTCCNNLNDGTCGANNFPNYGQKIIGGSDSRIDFWPWQAFFFLGTEKCGGTLIDDLWVVSAAHCFESYRKDRIAEFNLTVLLGLNDTSVLTSISMQARRVAENDIALVRLDRPIARSESVTPVCLPNGELPPVGTNCIITGYGTTNPNSTQLPKNLQQANVPIVDDETCRQAYKDFRHPMDPTKMICAGLQEGGRDACRGDSGGPLVCQRCNSCDWYLAGVTSYGRGCAKKDAYGVYTRVVQYEDWIASKIASIDVAKKTCEPTKWGEWSDWSACTQECGGTQTRDRQCLNGIHGIPGCTGSKSEQRQCTTQNQRQWTVWSECSATCGGGEQFRTRTCMPGNLKTRTQTRACETQVCIGWSLWTNWSPCANPCAQEIRFRTRSCAGGSEGDVGCQGSSRQQKTCALDPTCTDFGPWTTWSTCSKTCGGGIRTASRRCNGDAWGLTCNGDATKTETCSSQSCGNWGDWSKWGACSKPCGSGERSRSRSCVGGTDCSGGATQTEACNAQACATWSAWSDWSSCSRTCGGGTRTRTRSCLPTTGTCSGSSFNEEQCNTDACEVAAMCSDFCITYVKSGYCHPDYRPWLTSFCGHGCCGEPFCTNTATNCDSSDFNRCFDTSFAGQCLRRCGYCA